MTYIIIRSGFVIVFITCFTITYGTARRSLY